MVKKYLRNSMIVKSVYIVLAIIIILDLLYLLFIHKNENSQKIDYYGESPNLNLPVKIQNAYLFQDNWKDTISLSDLVKDKSILVLRIPLVSCQECKYAELANFELLYEQHNVQNICALITVSSTRDLKVLATAFDFNFLKIGTKKLDILDIPIEKLNRPFYFILHPNLNADMFFLPEKGNEKSTFEYFEKIKESIN